jgi:hypothetical protein
VLAGILRDLQHQIGTSPTLAITALLQRATQMLNDAKELRTMAVSA